LQKYEQERQAGEVSEYELGGILRLAIHEIFHLSSQLPVSGIGFAAGPMCDRSRFLLASRGLADLTEKCVGRRSLVKFLDIEMPTWDGGEIFHLPELSGESTSCCSRRKA
jgi:hypothetical protein